MSGGLPIKAERGVMLADPRRPRIYVSEDSMNALTVINTAKGAIEKRLGIGSEPAGLALSADHSTLYIALSGGSQVAVVDLDTLTPRESLQLGCQPFDLACPQAGLLYVTARGKGSRDSFHLVDLVSKRIMTSEAAARLYSNALVEARPGVPGVFFGETGLSPATVYRVDFGSAPGKLNKVHEHGAIGSNLQDMRLSPDGQRLYICCGSPYYVQVFDAGTMLPVGQLKTGPYPERAEPSPDGSKVFVAHGEKHVDVFDAATFLKIGSFTGAAEPINLCASGDGKKLAVLFAEGLWMVDVANMGPVASDS
jgi:DNA-binding beta-propeller fold protein YncE